MELSKFVQDICWIDYIIIVVGNIIFIIFILLLFCVLYINLPCLLLFILFAGWEYLWTAFCKKLLYQSLAKLDSLNSGTQVPNYPKLNQAWNLLKINLRSFRLWLACPAALEGVTQAHPKPSRQPASHCWHCLQHIDKVMATLVPTKISLQLITIDLHK